MTSANIVPQVEIAGQTTIDDQVIGAIANTAAREVEGVTSLGTSSVRRLLAERLGGAERRARGVGVRVRPTRGQRRHRVERVLWVLHPGHRNQVRENVSRTYLGFVRPYNQGNQHHRHRH